MDRNSAKARGASFVRHYRYNNKFYMIVFLYGPLSVLILVGFGIYVQIFGVGADRIYATLLFVGWGAFAFALLVVASLKHRPISNDESGIWDNLFGRKRRYIRWDEVSEIVRRRYRNSVGNLDRERYVCSGGGKIIRFDDNVKNLRMLLDDINAYAGRHNFKLFLSDAGSEVRRCILSGQISRSERRTKIREGIKTRLPRL